MSSTKGSWTRGARGGAFFRGLAFFLGRGSGSPSENSSPSTKSCARAQVRNTKYCHLKSSTGRLPHACLIEGSYKNTNEHGITALPAHRIDLPCIPGTLAHLGVAPANDPRTMKYGHRKPEHGGRRRLGGVNGGHWPCSPDPGCSCLLPQGKQEGSRERVEACMTCDQLSRGP